VAGYTDSAGAGSNDFWVLKLTAAGAIDWQYAYGTSGDEQARSVTEVSDGYVVAGYSPSRTGTSNDAWLIKLATDGSVTWEKTYGKASYDGRAYAVTAAPVEGLYSAGVVAAGVITIDGLDGLSMRIDANGNPVQSRPDDQTYLGVDTTCTRTTTSVSAVGSSETVANRTDTKTAITLTTSTTVTDDYALYPRNY